MPSKAKSLGSSIEKQGKKAHNREKRETLVESLKDRKIPVKNKDREILGESHEDRESFIESQNEEKAIPQLVEMKLDISTNWAGTFKENFADLSSGRENSLKNVGK